MKVEVVLLDLGLPDFDGTVVCRAIRAISDVPIIVTGRAETGACIRSLRCGADDYLVKPYDISELLARIHAVRRRCTQPSRTDPVVRRGDVAIDLARLIVSVAGKPVLLSTKELQVLALIAAERGEVCSRDRLIVEIWGRPWPGATSTLNVHIVCCGPSSAAPASSKPSEASATGSAAPSPTPGPRRRSHPELPPPALPPFTGRQSAELSGRIVASAKVVLG